MSARTAKVFDLMFKSIIKEASPQALVHLINGIFKKNYPLDTQVKVEPTEFVKEHPKSGKLEKIISDIVKMLIYWVWGLGFGVWGLVFKAMFFFSRFKPFLCKIIQTLNPKPNTLKNNCKRNNYLTKVDVARLLHKLSMLNGELYGRYKEFSEVDVTLKKLMDSGIDEAIAKAEKKGMERGLNQGISRTAKAMKASGEAIDKIMRYTGLSRREIAAL